MNLRDSIRVCMFNEEYDIWVGIENGGEVIKIRE